MVRFWPCLMVLCLVLAACPGQADVPTTAPATTPATAPTTAPAVSVFGVTDAAGSVVFVVDHSASATEFPEPLRQEMARVFGSLQAPTQVAVYVFSEDLRALVGDKLAEATAELRASLAKAYESTDSAGNPEGTVPAFAQAVKQAIALKPEAIFLITYTKPSAKLAEAVKQLNKDAHVRINVVGLIGSADQAVEDALAQIAKDSGGACKVLREKDVAKK